MHRFLFVPLVFFLAQCSSTLPSGTATPSVPSYSGRMPEIINVSAYDPKERQRSGRGYSENDVSALRANGASGLIARVGKGGNLDEKCANFLTAADRAGMLVGVYYRVQKHVDAVKQADQMVDRVQALARSRSWTASSILLCGDYDGDLPLSSIIRFMDRVKSRTGVVPVAYLENSTHLKQLTSATRGADRAKLLQAPYWLALYSHESGAGPDYPAPGDPKGLLDQYRLWPNWTLWQYGGVNWEHGRSSPKVYNHGRYPFSPYFGDMDRPLERNVFNGSPAQLASFWQRHGLRVK